MSTTFISGFDGVSHQITRVFSRIAERTPSRSSIAMKSDDAPQRAKRRADLVASAPAPRDLELLLGQPAGLVVAAEEQ